MGGEAKEQDEVRLMQDGGVQGRRMAGDPTDLGVTGVRRGVGIRTGQIWLGSGRWDDGCIGQAMVWTDVVRAAWQEAVDV